MFLFTKTMKPEKCVSPFRKAGQYKFGNYSSKIYLGASEYLYSGRKEAISLLEPK